jgi:hypothetical protein
MVVGVPSTVNIVVEIPKFVRNWETKQTTESLDGRSMRARGQLWIY